MSRDVQAEIQDTLDKNPVLLFMKGSPSFPQCGFSAQVAYILSELNVEYVGVDVLSDPEVREGIKEFSAWPTIPQLYIKGEFIGGCDIVKDLFESGELRTKAVDSGVISTES
jgi:monothiol glutaredoxin